MRKSVLDLTEILKKEVDSNLTNKKYTRDKALAAYKKFNFPVDKIADFISGRWKVSETDYFTWFVLAWTIKKDVIKEFFTESEIELYGNAKCSDDKPVLPLTIEVVEISNDQWVGKITVKDLMRLRDSQMIRYNENTQRTLRRVVRGGIETYRIYVNNVAVNNIEQSFLSGIYIPNMITLNIPEDAEFSYKNGKLTITKMDYFDILDGYHRYRAISNIYNDNNDFDYNMELRIVNFPEDKAKQFIWQEDQKTRMRRIESDQLNINNAGNQVVESLNQSVPFNGKIGRNESIIDAPVLARAINFFYFEDKKKAERKDILNVKKALVTCGLLAEEDDSELFDKPWSYSDIVTFVAASKNTDNFITDWNEKKSVAETAGLFKNKAIARKDLNRI